MMKRAFKFFFLTIGFLFFLGSANAQYWFGPKVGGSLSHFIYQDSDYVIDSFKVSPTYNYEFGGVVIYQANNMFSVQGEATYEIIDRTLRSRPNFGQEVYSKMRYRFLSVPMLFRVSFGGEPIHYYLSGGIKLKFWMGGKGKIVSGEPEFGEPGEIIDKIVFRQSKSDPVAGTYAVREANIMQFGLSLGGGMYFDLVTNGRLLLDARYTFGHSNFGFNNNPDFSNDITGYNERFTFRANTLSVSLAYLFEFDQQLQRKGKSTSEKSNKAHRK